MKPIRDVKQVEYYGVLIREMMLIDKGQECEFNPDWVRNQGWKVVPAESMARIPVPDIPRIVSALKESGYPQCIAVFNEPGYIRQLPVTVKSEPPSDMATCHLLTVDEADFQDFNRELGAFRSVLLPEDRAWAIACNEWYNLFGAKCELLESLLGKPIEQAREEFAEVASALKGNSGEHLLEIAGHYATL